MKSVVVDEVAIVGEMLRPLLTARAALEKRAALLTERRDDNVAKHIGNTATEVSVLRQSSHQFHFQTTATLNTVDCTTGRIHQQGSRIESKVDGVVTGLISHISDQHAHTIRIQEKYAALREKFARQTEILNNFRTLAEEKQRNQMFYAESESRYASRVYIFPT